MDPIFKCNLLIIRVAGLTSDVENADFSKGDVITNGGLEVELSTLETTSSTHSRRGPSAEEEFCVFNIKWEDFTERLL